MRPGLLSLLLFVPAAAARPVQDSPAQAAAVLVGRFGAGFTALAARSDASPSERLDAARVLVAETCDPLAAIRRLGPAGEELAASESWRAVLADAVAARVAAHSEDGGQGLEAGAVQDAPDGSFLVSARLTRDSEQALELTFEVAGPAGAPLITAIREDGSDWLASPAWSQALEAGGSALESALRGEPGAYLATPPETIARLHAALIESMKGTAGRSFQERLERLAPVVSGTHDMQAIARLVLSRAWPGLEPAQQEEFVSVFQELSVATYASRFDSFSGERFRLVSDKPGPKGSWIVKTALVKSDGDEIPFEYQMIRREGRWRILNIIVDGVSDVATKRAEYKSVLEQGGLPKLLRELRRQIADLEAEG